jgi:FkbM family methyltransferase
LSPLNFNDRSKIGSSSWLLKETRGASLLDKFVLNALKGAYITIRVLIRIVLGKKRRDKFYLDKGINFSDFLYDSVDLLGLDTSLFLVFDVPRYNYKFYSMITRKADNFLIHDMYLSMSLHEDDILQLFSPKEGDTVVDVGAAFGLYTLISSMKVGSGGMVIAIEAQLDSFKMLNRNIKLNNLTNALTLNYAAYSSMTKLKLYSSYSLIEERAGKNTQKFLEVEARTLDYLLSKFTQLTEVNWIKIDVEGAEFEVLKGAHNILSNSKDIRLLIEIHGQDNYEPIVKYLGQYNFETEFEKNYIGGDRHVIFRKYPAMDC